MSEQDSAVVKATYAVDERQLADYRLGVRYQAYANDRMIFSKGWDRYFLHLRDRLSVYAGMLAATIYTIILLAIPGFRTVAGYWLLAPAPMVAAAIWLVLWRTERMSANRYTEAFARWNIEFDQMHSGEHHVTASASGFKLATRTETLETSWHRYHLTLVQPENLVLVFHGMVVVIPNAALSGRPEELAGCIARWTGRPYEDAVDGSLA